MHLHRAYGTAAVEENSCAKEHYMYPSPAAKGTSLVARAMACPCTCQPPPRLLWLSRGLLLERREHVVDHRVDEHEPDGDAGADLLLLGEHLAGDGSHVDHHDDALGGVGDGGGDGARRLDGHCRELIVQVEGEARDEEADLEVAVGGEQVHEGAPLGALRRKHDGERDGKRKALGDCKLVGDSSHPVLEAGHSHQLFGLGALEGGEGVADHAK
mmetsp:Transcript_48760/g.157562  ORF Transcript_48760/g.157562 Transcript_48760/m.157562 type:complete len:214 (+) Transcript_48760:163-804(+)